MFWALVSNAWNRKNTNMETAKRTKTRTAKLSASYITEVGIMTEADTASIVSNDLSLTIYSLLENECTSNIHLLDTKR
jgi:hypothetical protein